jgi:hypothetical protein
MKVDAVQQRAGNARQIALDHRWRAGTVVPRVPEESTLAGVHCSGQHEAHKILLVDEVLAVGDIAFQKKCLGKMESVARGGRTVVFVSHNMGAITSLCQSAIWLDNGQVAEKGTAHEVVSHYEEKLLKLIRGQKKQHTDTDKPIAAIDPELKPRDGISIPVLRPKLFPALELKKIIYIFFIRYLQIYIFFYNLKPTSIMTTYSITKCLFSSP